MRAAVAYGIGRGFVTEDVELAAPVGREVLIDVKASGLCATDLSIVDHDTGMGYPFPAVLGHEIAGVVTEVGSDVTQVKVGDHVVGSLIQYCGQCRACLRGEPYSCTDPGFTLRHDGSERLGTRSHPVYQGSGLGGFAAQSLVHEQQLAVVPDEMPFPQASLLGCGTITGAGAVINTARVRPGASVAVIGTGGVGLNAISGARICGATTIIAVDLLDSKLEAARRFGATHTINAGNENAVDRIQEITGGGADHVFEVIGHPVTQAQAIDAAGTGGGTYLVGMAPSGTSVTYDTSFMLLAYHRHTHGVAMGSTNHKLDIPMYAQLYLQGRLNLDDLVSQEIGIDDIDEAYRQLSKGEVIRSVITRF